MMFFCRVRGIPAPQGSKSYMGTYKDKQGRQRGKMVESSKKVAPWRQAVTWTCVEANTDKLFFADAVRLTLEFVMPRLKSMRPGVPVPYHTKKPDLSKLWRCVEDAITDAGLWRDDSQICECGPPIKRYAEEGESPGCMIIIEALSEKVRPERTRKAPAPKPRAKKQAKTKPDGGLYFC